MLRGWLVENEKLSAQEHAADAIAMYVQHYGELPKVVKARKHRLDFVIPEIWEKIQFLEWDQANVNIYYVGFDEDERQQRVVVDTQVVDVPSSIDVVLETNDVAVTVGEPIHILDAKEICPPADKIAAPVVSPIVVNEAKQLSRGFRSFMRREK